MTRIIIGESKVERDRYLLTYISTLFQKEITSIVDLLKIPDVHILSSTENSIGIEEVKNFTKSVIYKPFEEDFQVAIINDADKLTADAQNALLKTLEEPPAQTIYILLAQREKNLLETILSRGEKHYTANEEEGSNDFTHIPEFLEADLPTRLDLMETLGGEKERGEIIEFLKELLRYYKAEFEKEMIRGGTSSLREKLEIIQATIEQINGNVSKKLALWNMTLQLEDR